MHRNLPVRGTVDIVPLVSGRGRRARASYSPSLRPRASCSPSLRPRASGEGVVPLSRRLGHFPSPLHHNHSPPPSSLKPHALVPLPVFHLIVAISSKLPLTGPMAVETFSWTFFAATDQTEPFSGFNVTPTTETDIVHQL